MRISSPPTSPTTTHILTTLTHPSTYFTPPPPAAAANPRVLRRPTRLQVWSPAPAALASASASASASTSTSTPMPSDADAGAAAIDTSVASAASAATATVTTTTAGDTDGTGQRSGASVKNAKAGKKRRRDGTSKAIERKPWFVPLGEHNATAFSEITAFYGMDDDGMDLSKVRGVRRHPLDRATARSASTPTHFRHNAALP